MSDTIAAIATPPGRGGIGIIRLSGPQARQIAEQLCKQTLIPRHAHYCSLLSADTPQDLIDQGIVLFFPAPNSFTGEDVVELQGHGGPIILDQLLSATLELGARPARAGEFSERAFLNDKLDLAQAEAVADLINSGSRQAARGAMRSLQGEFSNTINSFAEQLLQLRVYVEAALDFPDEEVDFLQRGQVQEQLQQLLQGLITIFAKAKQGSVLREGIHIAIAGRPNAGKSSLLNALAGYESAIVSAVAGTTRDVVRE
ncbi:MAG: tRNA modification GTPase, partial [Pseudomonadales bacterium]